MVLAFGAMEPLTVAAAALGRGVLVAAAGVVVVLAILLVFVMVLRGAGSSRQKASGLDYDPNQGPMGQPQNAARDDAAGGAAWGAPMGQMGQMGQMSDRFDPMDQGFGPPSGQGRPSPAMQQAPGWGAPFADQGQANGGAAWGAPNMTPDRWNDPVSPAGQMGGQMGQMGQMAGMNDWANPPSQGRGAPPTWDTPAATANTGAGWNGANPGQGASATRPGADAANPWDAQPAAPSQPAWGGPQGAASPQPWDAPAAANPQGWGAPPTGAAQGVGAQGVGAQPWDAPAAPPSQPTWGGPPAAPSQPAWGGAAQGVGAQPWDAQPAAPSQPAWGGPANDPMLQPTTPRGAGYDAPRLIERKPNGREFDLSKDRLTIGRHRESDVFLEDLAVSRLHTTITRDGSGRYILRDENSANGTYVNGQRVSEHVLQNGDEVQVGQTVLVFQQR